PDTIFMEEDCREEEGKVVLLSGIKRGANLRSRGEDIRAGDAVLKAGARLRPQEIGLAASLGCTELTVYKRLKAAVFSTGDEIRDPGSELGEGCVYDANRFGVIGLLRNLGCAVTDLSILPDDEETIAAALANAADSHDLLITSGGVSLGEEDHVKAAVERNGSLHFWRLAIKPGRPIALGQVGPAVFVGLPGNPAAAMVTFMLIARPVVLLLSGAKENPVPRYSVRAGFSCKKKTGRREWHRARITNDNGVAVAELYPAGGSGILSSMVWAGGLVELPEAQGPIEEGDMVDYLPFGEVLT
ncbi:MAG: molybdopterin molybdotransferase MoeA, partial [Rhodospirillales bacterium]|nr:molybdopterin molybdotransferase MoeA [Rhodospirillales bacterium]